MVAGSYGRFRRRRQPETGYLPRCRWARVRLSILRCFFLRMRLRRFLIRDPMTGRRLTAPSGIATAGVVGTDHSNI